MTSRDVEATRGLLTAANDCTSPCWQFVTFAPLLRAVAACEHNRRQTLAPLGSLVSVHWRTLQELPSWDWSLAMRGGQQLPELPALTIVRVRACRLDACANRLLWRSPALRLLDVDGPAVNLRAAALFW